MGIPIIFICRSRRIAARLSEVIERPNAATTTPGAHSLRATALGRNAQLIFSALARSR
jgi:hypothetical protein